MKKILFALIAVVMAIAMIGSAFAYFSDSASSNNSQFQAGTLYLDVNGSHSDTGTFTIDLGNMNIAPGDVQTDPTTITITNDGSLDLAWFGYFRLTNVTKHMDQAIYIDYANMDFNTPSSTWDTSDNFITDGVGSGLYGSYYTTNLADTDPLGVISLHTWNNNSYSNVMGAGIGVQTGALKPANSYVFTFKLGMAPLAGNSFQGGTIDVQYVVVATQVNTGALNTINSSATLNPYGRINIADTSATGFLGWLNDQIAKQP